MKHTIVFLALAAAFTAFAEIVPVNLAVSKSVSVSGKIVGVSAGVQTGTIGNLSLKRNRKLSVPAYTETSTVGGAEMFTIVSSPSWWELSGSATNVFFMSGLYVVGNNVWGAYNYDLQLVEQQNSGGVSAPVSMWKFSEFSYSGLEKTITRSWTTVGNASSTIINFNISEGVQLTLTKHNESKTFYDSYRRVRTSTKMNGMGSVETNGLAVASGFTASTSPYLPWTPLASAFSTVTASDVVAGDEFSVLVDGEANAKVGVSLLVDTGSFPAN